MPEGSIVGTAILELNDVGKTFRSADGHARPVLDGRPRHDGAEQICAILMVERFQAVADRDARVLVVFDEKNRQHAGLRRVGVQG
jgi:hypothetical protein